jgi:hypothetical protein
MRPGAEVAMKIALLIIALLLSICSATSCGKKVPIPKQMSPHYIATKNYSADLAKWQYYDIRYPIDKLPSDITPMMENHWQEIGKRIPDRPLTPLEKKRLGVWVDPSNGNKLQMEECWWPVANYVAKYGKVPASSEELLAGTYLSQRNLQVAASNPQYIAMFNPEQFARPLVNPATGVPYTDFQSKSWTPFGIDFTITRITPPPHTPFLVWLRSLRLRGHEVVSNLRPPSYSADVDVKMYGEKPGTILYTDTIHF